MAIFWRICRRRLPAKVRLMIDFLVERLGQPMENVPE